MGEYGLARRKRLWVLAGIKKTSRREGLLENVRKRKKSQTPPARTV